MGSTQSTGVARSLELLEPDRHDAGGRQERARPSRTALLGPLLDRMRGLAERLSPAGHRQPDRPLPRHGRATRPAWTVERIMGAKGLGLVIGVRAGRCCCSGFEPQGPARRGRGRRRPASSCPTCCSTTPGPSASRSCSKGLADALDMLTVCVEAGQGFDAAILQVAAHRHRARSAASSPACSPRSRSASPAARPSPRWASAPRRPRSRTSSAPWSRPTGWACPIAAVLREQTKEMRVVAPSAGRGEGAEGHGQDPLPAAAVHLPGAVHRHHRPGRHPIMQAFSGGGSEPPTGAGGRAPAGAPASGDCAG